MDAGRVRRLNAVYVRPQPDRKVHPVKEPKRASSTSMSGTISSPRVARRPSKRRRAATLQSVQPAQTVDSHRNALQAIRTFLKGRSSYDVFPVSFRLIVLDNKLEVKKALSALIANGQWIDA